MGTWLIAELRPFIKAYLDLGKEAPFTKLRNVDEVTFINAGGTVRSLNPCEVKLE